MDISRRLLIVNTCRGTTVSYVRQCAEFSSVCLTGALGAIDRIAFLLKAYNLFTVSRLTSSPNYSLAVDYSLAVEFSKLVRHAL